MAQGLRQAFEVHGWVEEYNVQPMVAHDAANLGGRSAMSQEILLADLNAVEACSGSRGQFVGEFSDNRQGRNCGFHGVALLVGT
jgi:hypothetical protein